MSPAARERAAVVSWLDCCAALPGAGDYGAGWRMCAFNAAREIERGDHLPPTSVSGIPLTRRT